MTNLEKRQYEYMRCLWTDFIKDTEREWNMDIRTNMKIYQMEELQVETIIEELKKWTNTDKYTKEDLEDESNARIEEAVGKVYEDEKGKEYYTPPIGWEKMDAQQKKKAREHRQIWHDISTESIEGSHELQRIIQVQHDK